MEDLKSQLTSVAREAGFEAVGFTTPDAIPGARGRLGDFLGQGRHGDMSWMETTAPRRGDPAALWPEARSIVVLGLSYAPDADPMAHLEDGARATISVYAHGKDYHDIVKKKLKRVAGWLHRTSGAEVKVFVDTAPVMEKPLAEAAGVGWQGKHTNLVSRPHGSWLFLGSIFTTAPIAPDAPEADHCGNCRRCLDICPTDAFPAPYQLDARRCISYLTIEHKGHIPVEFREAIGNRIYGCDDCLAVCPWNKFAQAAREIRFHGDGSSDGPEIEELLELDDAAFRARFRGTPVKRTGRDRFLRNVLIAAGNSKRPAIWPKVERLLADDSPLVRGAAVWASGRLLDGEAFESLRARLEPCEHDDQVRAEWQGGLVS